MDWWRELLVTLLMSFYGGYPPFFSSYSQHAYLLLHASSLHHIHLFNHFNLVAYLTHSCTLSIHLHLLVPYHIHSFQPDEQTHAIVRSVSIAHSYTPTPLHSCSFSRADLSRHRYGAWNTRLNGIEWKSFMHGLICRDTDRHGRM